MHSYPLDFPLCLHLSAVKGVMLGRIEKFKHFFNRFLAGAFDKGRVVVS